MTLPALDNLVRTGLLKAEPTEPREFDNRVRSVRTRLDDAKQTGLSPESRFDLAYNAAHALSLAALRWHGYRPNRQRYVVFQPLVHTLKLPPEMARILDKCHSMRNLVEYGGESEIDIRLLEELIRATNAVAAAVGRLGPVVPSS